MVFIESYSKDIHKPFAFDLILFDSAIHILDLQIPLPYCLFGDESIVNLEVMNGLVLKLFVISSCTTSKFFTWFVYKFRCLLISKSQKRVIQPASACSGNMYDC